MKIIMQDNLNNVVGVQMAQIPVGRLAENLRDPGHYWLKLADAVVLSCQSGCIIRDGLFTDPYRLLPEGTTITIVT